MRFRWRRLELEDELATVVDLVLGDDLPSIKIDVPAISVIRGMRRFLKPFHEPFGYTRTEVKIIRQKKSTTRYLRRHLSLAAKWLSVRLSKIRARRIMI